jgi:L-ribulose-5-phosphate 4-epimerase
MDSHALKKAVFDAVVRLRDADLLRHTWGSVSAVNRDAGVIVIEPRRTSHAGVTPETLVAVDFKTGKPLAGEGEPSTDLPSHLYLYKKWGKVNTIAHPHSCYAVSWAQACVSIPCLGTTHAEYFYGEVPLVRPLTAAEVSRDYAHNIGRAIVEHFAEFGLRPLETPAALVPYHGPYAWGASIADAVEHALVLEEIARMAYHTIHVNPRLEGLPRELLDRHSRARKRASRETT